MQRHPLLLAAENCNFQTVSKLLNSNAGLVHYCDEETGETALHLTIKNGNVALEQNQDLIAIKLLDSDAEVNRGRRDGKTPLYLAVENNKTWMASMLLKHQANPNKAANDGTTPLLMAIQKNNLEIVALLIQYRATIHENMYEALENLCKNNPRKKPFIRALKDRLLTVINRPSTPNNIDEKIRLLTDALNKHSYLGRIMRIKCGVMACNMKRGTLLKIHTALVCAREYKTAIVDFNGKVTTTEDIVTAIHDKKQGRFEYLLSSTEISDAAFNNIFLRAAISHHRGMMQQLIKTIFSSEAMLTNLQNTILFAQQQCRGYSPCQRRKAARLQDAIKMIKDDIIRQIEASEGEDKERKATEALDPASEIGKIIHIKRKNTACKQGHGSLKLIQKILDNARQLSPLRINALHRPAANHGGQIAGFEARLRAVRQ